MKSGIAVGAHRGLIRGLALLGGVVIALTGYGYLVGSHASAGERLPFWVHAAIPFTALGPDSPSVPVFLLLLICNIATWSTLLYLGAVLFLRITARQDR